MYQTVNPFGFTRAIIELLPKLDTAETRNEMFVESVSVYIYYEDYWLLADSLSLHAGVKYYGFGFVLIHCSLQMIIINIPIKLYTAAQSVYKIRNGGNLISNKPVVSLFRTDGRDFNHFYLKGREIQLLELHEITRKSQFIFSS